MLNNKSILITGATGSFGKTIVKNILKKYPKIKKIVLFSRDELKQFDLQRDLDPLKIIWYAEIENTTRSNMIGILTVDEFYTDSLSDRPMMEVSKSNFLVKRDQIQKFIIGD